MREQIIIFPHYQNDCKSVDELISHKKFREIDKILKEACNNDYVSFTNIVSNNDSDK